MTRIEQIAKVCHEANRALCENFGDYCQMSWEEADEWQRQSAIKGVEFALANPDASASAQHDAWMRDKLRDGWTVGTKKDALKKTHPCMVPYEQLPFYQRIKDHLFRGVVAAFAAELEFFEN